WYSRQWVAAGVDSTPSKQRHRHAASMAATSSRTPTVIDSVGVRRRDRVRRRFGRLVLCAPAIRPTSARIGGHSPVVDRATRFPAAVDRGHPAEQWKPATRAGDGRPVRVGGSGRIADRGTDTSLRTAGLHDYGDANTTSARVL